MLSPKEQCEELIDYLKQRTEAGYPLSRVENEDVVSLLTLMQEMATTLKDQCCCPGERDYNWKEILCDGCELLKKWNGEG